MVITDMDKIFDLGIKIAIPLAIGLAVWLPIAYSVRREWQRFAKQLDGLNYELRQPKFVFWIGVVDAALFFILVVFVPFSDNETFTPLVATGFIAFSLLGTFLAVYALQWRITVQYNRLIVRMPFEAAREINIEDITTVKQKYNGIIAYINAKRVFTVDNHVVGFELISAQLYEAGKMESVQKKASFCVQQHKGNLVISIIGLIFFGGCLIWTIFWPNDSVNIFVYVCFSVFTLLDIYLLIHTLRWKIIVAGDIVTYRNILGTVKLFSVKAITRVNVKKESIFIFIDEKKTIKVAVGCSNYAILVERLRSEHIPFYIKGKLLEQ